MNAWFFTSIHFFFSHILIVFAFFFLQHIFPLVRQVHLVCVKTIFYLGRSSSVSSIKWKSTGQCADSLCNNSEASVHKRNSVCVEELVNFLFQNCLWHDRDIPNIKITVPWLGLWLLIMIMIITIKAFFIHT